MSDAPIKLVHLSAHVRGFGGVEALLERHARMDVANAFDASQVALFDRGAKAVSERNYASLKFGWRNFPVTMRRRLQAVLARHAGGVILWHNAWGLPWFADVDSSARRIAYLHYNEALFRTWLPALRGRVDGVICVNPLAADAVRRSLPDLPPDRVVAPAQPITPPDGLSLERPPLREWVIGHAGRLVHAQKRTERLIPFVKELRRLNVPFRLEVIGQGPLQAPLQRHFAGDRAVEFFGRVDKAEYWRRMATWDAAIFTGDAEGVPMVMLEALAVGALPIYPAIGGSLGDDYVPRIEPCCVYPAGDLRAAARAVQALMTFPSERLTTMRSQGRELAAPHRLACYDAEFAEFVRMVARSPRISAASIRRPARWFELLPLGLVTRAFPRTLWE